MREALPAEFARLVQPDGSVVVPGAVADGVLRLLVLGVTVTSQQNAGGRPTDAVMDVLHALNQAAVKAADPTVSASGPDMTESVILGVRVSVMTSSEAAELLACTDRSVRRACKQGRLPATKAGRQWLIRDNDLDTYRFGPTHHGKRTPGGTRNGC